MNKSVLTEYQTLYLRSLQLFIDMTLKTLNINRGLPVPGLSRLNPESFSLPSAQFVPRRWTGQSCIHTSLLVTPQRNRAPELSLQTLDVDMEGF